MHWGPHWTKAAVGGNADDAREVCDPLSCICILLEEDEGPGCVCMSLCVGQRDSADMGHMCTQRLGHSVLGRHKKKVPDAGKAGE